jgi:peptidyl-prolyl cis-trans isomerase SurA
LADYSPDDILITIDNTAVTAEEFIYSFKKSHQNEDSLSESAIDDYLRLFINYKLKVLEAKSSGYDTAELYIKELTGYQEQLKSSYRTAEKVIQDLKREAYERMKQEVKASHILIRVSENALPEDTVAALQRIIELKERARKENFEKLALAFSEDPSAKVNKGDLGYFTAFQMVYPFENAAYNTQPGEISDPVRTRYGYHILKVHDKRPSAYKIKLYQVQLSGKTPESKAQVNNKIFEIHEMLQNGLKPEQVAESIDKEQYTLQTGSLPSLTLSQVPREIQEVAMQLTVPGEISDPVKSDLGWHIFILEERSPLPAYEEMENQLDRMVRKTDRLATYQEQLMDQLYKKHDVDLQVSKKSISKVVDGEEDISLFKINNRNFVLSQFIKDLRKNKVALSNERAVSKAYSDYINEQVLNVEDQEIIAENAELRWLLKEYEEGLLLFNIMEDSVWNRAVHDKEGLEEYNRKKAKKAMISTDSTLSKFESGAIVDYQQYLDEQWIKRLRTKYTVMVNQPLLDRIYNEILGMSIEI